MHIRCPHCHHAIAIVDDSSFKDVECPSCGSSFNLVGSDEATATHRQSLRTIAHFELIEHLGTGASGSVWKAKDTKLDRMVAIKIPRKEQLSEEEMESFLREARAAGQLNHPHIVSVHEVGRDGNTIYIATDYVEGTTLKGWMNGQPISPREAAKLCIKIAEALDHAHKKGVIHRDLKPSNILIDAQREPHVTDFGLARRESGEISITVDGAVLGTLFYMPPEQAKGKSHEADQRADVYSLGVILYEMLTGEVPFRGEKRMVILQILTDDPLPPRKRFSAIPRNLETVCLKCLRKETDRRYQTASELGDDLRRALENQPIKARRVTRAEKAWLWSRRNPRSVASLLIAVFLILGFAVIANEWRMRLQAKALVVTVLEADTRRLTELIQRLPDFGRRAKPYLTDQLGPAYDAEAGPIATSRGIHASLALAWAFQDRSQIPILEGLLLSPSDSQFKYFEPALSALEPFKAEVAERMWLLLHDSTGDADLRFRAGLALAVLQPESKKWSQGDYQFLAEQLVLTNAIDYGGLCSFLAKISDDLLAPLEVIFADLERPEIQQLAAANALRQFAARDSARLARLLTHATPVQFKAMLGTLRHTVDHEALTYLRSLILKQPADDLKQAERIELGRRRAGSAILLIHMGAREAVFDALRFQDDPEALTQFVHRCRARGVTAAQLFELLDHADLLRQAADGPQRKVEDRVLFGILLALGEFAPEELLQPRQALVDRIADWYANDPSSAIHGAAGWLLRHWGLEQTAALVDETPTFDHVPTLEEIGGREWFVLGIDIPDEDTTVETRLATQIYFTFVMFPAGEYSMGLSNNEESHDAIETLHQVKLTRPIAVCDREIVWRQFSPYDGGRHHGSWQRQFKRTLSDMEPVFAVTWFEAVAYCRWLATRAGMDESDQSFASIELPPEAETGFFELPDSTNWPLELGRPGFRLLTEAEWEYTCRSGTRTAYSFGNDVELLGNYAWFQDNSGEWSHPVGQLRPNLGGVFDIHGNLYEWCYDWHTLELEDGAVDPFGPDEGSDRLVRGGSWLYAPRICRAAYRNRYHPADRYDSLGLRLVFTPSSGAGTLQSSEAQSAGR